LPQFTNHADLHNS